MVTAGGNQAFAMVALALLDPGDRVLLVRQALQHKLGTMFVMDSWFVALNEFRQR